MTRRTVWINGPLVRRRLLEQNLSEREFARHTGLTSTTTRAIVSNSGLTSALSVADLYRMIALLGVTIPDLLVEAPEASEPDGEDHTVLIRLLQAEKRAHDAVRIALALDWTLDRLYRAAADADAALPAVGLRLHRTNGGYTLRPADEEVEEARRRLALLRDDDEGITASMARVLIGAYDRTLSDQEDRNDHRVQLAQLHNLGALNDRRPDKGSRNSLSDDTAYCLDF